MGIHVDENTCNRCGTADEPMCVRDCPGDLMFIKGNDKAAIVDNRECWDCAACVKVCPTQAIHMELSPSLAEHGVTLRGRALKHKTVWRIRLRNDEERGYDTPSTGKPPFSPNL
ncbi:MAG: 4Fe-4S dicluster domain-containing protein [Polyangiales bacterium]